MSRREQILDVALELLERDGAESLTMRSIAEAVGMRAPSLYKHVPDKQSLEAGLIARGLAAQAGCSSGRRGSACRWRRWPGRTGVGLGNIPICTG
jgi:AcrR family transcriptional regulator